MGNTVGSPARLTAEERSVVVGTILGDGHLEMLTSGSVRLSVAHGAAQRAYTAFLHRKLRRHIHASTPTQCTSLDRRNGRLAVSYRFRTVALQELNVLRSEFYNATSIKRIPASIGRHLDPIALAVWFMDDGSYKDDSRGLLLNTMAFSDSDHERLRDALRDRYDISTSLHRLRKWKRMYIPARYSQRFTAIISPHLAASMRYKLQYVVHDPVTTDPERVR